jgi:hypothetical protein
MVVVFVEIAHTPAATESVFAEFRENSEVWNMVLIVMDAACEFPDSMRWIAQPSALTTASPISRVLTLVVPVL